ncbi:MAG: FAD-binding protein [Parasphingorhabdus sp.]|nr:FAD-binding protein [Parasphingorhabdus sp.]
MTWTPPAPRAQRVPPSAALLDAIAARFGENALLSENSRRQYGSSEAHFPEMLPDAAVVARSTQDVVDCVGLCAQYAVPVIARGAGTSIEGNTLPVHGGVSIDMSLRASFTPDDSTSRTRLTSAFSRSISLSDIRAVGWMRQNPSDDSRDHRRHGHQE